MLLEVLGCCGLSTCSSGSSHVLLVDGPLLILNRVDHNLGGDCSIGGLLIELNFIVVDVNIFSADGDFITKDRGQLFEGNAFGFRHEEVDVEYTTECERDE